VGTPHTPAKGCALCTPAYWRERDFSGPPKPRYMNPRDIRLFIVSVYFSKQFIHYLCHVAHDSDGTPVLHAGWTNHTQ
jgi:hypothetical protein